MAMSMAVLFGCLFLATVHDQSQVRTRLAWIASKLSPVLDRQIVDDFKTAIDRVLTSLSCDAGGQPGCRMAARSESPAVGQAMQAASTANWFGTKEDPNATSQSPVTWLLDEPHAQFSPSGAEVFSISGTNVSDQALEGVHAVLKPDSSQRELELVLDVEGHNVEDGTVIPAGARFSLVSETPNEDGAKQFGGAILSFRYVQAGQRKTSILYLTPSMVARFANRG
jgi:hypothetical protein